MFRPLALALILLAACSPPAPSTPAAPHAAQATPPAANSPYPFPTIHGDTEAALLASACAYARDHFRAPQRAAADTPVIFKGITGMLANEAPDIAGFTTEPGIPGVLGFHDSFVAVEAADERAEARAHGRASPFDHYHLIELSNEDMDTLAARHWCPDRSDQLQFPDFMRGDVACIHKEQVAAAPPHAETLEAFTNVPVVVDNMNLVAWSGYRWSGNGGALILAPSVGIINGHWATGGGLKCPEIQTNADGDITHIPAYLDRDAWLAALAPVPGATH